MTNPKLFISYSWTNPDHESWVLNLATELRESGVDVILDKWDLREGHDANAFMEKMVSDQEIKKVALICDKAYAEKADGRSGGVGTETQIISSEVYAKQDQNKFVAVLKERDETGKPYLPTYYRSRIFIDLSDSESYVSNFERLLRWIFDKPLFIKPEIGTLPTFLKDDENSAPLGTSVVFKRTIDAIRNDKKYSEASLKEYLSTLSSGMEKLRIKDEDGLFDDEVMVSITSFLPFRNEAIELFLTIANYRDNNEIRVSIHRFFESLIPYLMPAKGISSYTEWDFDNFKFIIHELFLYAIASFIRYERFESASYLMQNEYYIRGNSEYDRDAMVPFNIFRDHLQSLRHRNDRLKLNRLSLRADLLSERCKGVGVDFRHLMQVDFILFIRDYLDHPDIIFPWFPETLVYIGRHGSTAFEVFARSKSAAYFEKAKVLLGINSKEDLLPLLEAFQKDNRLLPRWEFNSFNPTGLLGFNEIATKP
ncbi:MAG: TIR domain-containing protein [Deltaproteobacteria bacterium]|nr:TIR domain-containing protein [Deltaproteobacteria bacterium]